MPIVPTPTRSTGPPLAYPVPFQFIRARAPDYLLANRSMEPLTGIRLSLTGPGAMPALGPRSLPPGGELWVHISGDDLARSTALIVRWLRANGDEYLWRVVF